ncbi:hypothetical protein [Poriferisphaera sp. WC338]|uniref:hypothetical protein n=1 Tax=Poriferisphaera sp. WC338 TaxID=3425129 RepID=UPI003D814F5E
MITKSSFKLIIAAAISITLVNTSHAFDYVIPTDTAPSDTTLDDTLILNAGGYLGSFFTARDSSQVTINDGTVDDFFIATNTSQVFIHGGTIGHNASIEESSTMHITGGTFASTVNALDFSTVYISGGDLGEEFTASFLSTVHLSGGTISDTFSVNDSSTLNITGSNFKLIGSPILGLSTTPTEITTGPGEIITGLLADGTAFSLIASAYSTPNDFTISASATLNLILIPEPTTALLFLLTTLPFLTRRLTKQP